MNNKNKNKDKKIYRHPLKIKCPYCLKKNIEKWLFPWQMPMHCYYRHDFETLKDWESKPKYWLRDKKAVEKIDFDKQVREIQKNELLKTEKGGW